METQHFTLVSERDGLELGATLVIPEGEKRGMVQLSHGMAEHRERYLDFQKYLAEHGWVSVIHDHRGHGSSVREARDLGYFYAKGAEFAVRDLHQMTRHMRARFPGLPLVLFGHSMGSMIVRAYAKAYDADIEGLVVCGSPSKNPFAGAGMLIADLERALFGGRHRSKLLDRLAFGGFSKPFPGESPNRWVCADPETVRTYDADALCGYVFTANGFYNLFKLMRTCYSRSGWKVARPSLPVLFLSGEDDPCHGGREKFERAADFFRSRGYADVTAKLYPGMRHEILNEAGKAEVYADVLAFCERIRK